MTQENYEYIEFPDGLFGFEQNTKFVPIMVEEDSDAVLLLQSMENEELSFVVMNPFMLCEDYAKIGTKNQEELSFYVICVVKDDLDASTVNLKCPIVVNVVTRQARQVILDTKKYKLRHYLKEFKKEEA